MIAPGAERRRRPWQRRAAPALARGRAPRSSRRSRAGVGELVRAWVRRPARCAAARVLRPARARAQSTAEPWRPAASPRAVARGGGPQAPAAHQEAVGLRVDPRARAWRLPLASGQPGGPGPAARRAGCADGQARQPPAARRGPSAPPRRRAGHASGPVGHLGPRCGRCRCGPRRRRRRAPGAREGGARGRHAAPPRGRRLRVVVRRHEGAPPRWRGLLAVGGRAPGAERVGRGALPGDLRAGCAAGHALPGCTGGGARAGGRAPPRRRPRSARQLPGPAPPPRGRRGRSRPRWGAQDGAAAGAAPPACGHPPRPGGSAPATACSAAARAPVAGARTAAWGEQGLRTRCRARHAAPDGPSAGGRETGPGGLGKGGVAGRGRRRGRGQPSGGSRGACDLAGRRARATPGPERPGAAAAGAAPAVGHHAVGGARVAPGRRPGAPGSSHGLAAGGRALQAGLSRPARPGFGTSPPPGAPRPCACPVPPWHRAMGTPRWVATARDGGGHPGAAPTARWRPAAVRVAPRTWWGRPPHNAPAGGGQANQGSRVGETGPATSSLRLAPRPRTKTRRGRQGGPPGPDPHAPPSPGAPAPGAQARGSQAAGRRGLPARPEALTRAEPPSTPRSRRRGQPWATAEGARSTRRPRAGVHGSQGLERWRGVRGRQGAGARPAAPGRGARGTVWALGAALSPAWAWRGVRGQPPAASSLTTPPSAAGTPPGGPRVPQRPPGSGAPRRVAAGLERAPGPGRGGVERPPRRPRCARGARGVTPPGPWTSAAPRTAPRTHAVPGQRPRCPGSESGPRPQGGAARERAPGRGAAPPPGTGGARCGGWPTREGGWASWRPPRCGVAPHRRARPHGGRLRALLARASWHERPVRCASRPTNRAGGRQPAAWNA